MMIVSVWVPVPQVSHVLTVGVAGVAGVSVGAWAGGVKITVSVLHGAAGVEAGVSVGAWAGGVKIIVSVLLPVFDPQSPHSSQQPEAGWAG
jgi:hypothetical protein